MTPYERRTNGLLVAAAFLLGFVMGASMLLGFLSARHQLCETTCVELGDLPSTVVGQ